MAWYKEDTISNCDTPPWWVKRIGWLHGIWYNPVFQRGYRAGRKVSMGFKKGFTLGLWASGAISAIVILPGFVMHWLFYSLVEAALIFCGIVVIILVTILLVRHINAVLVLTPMAVSRNITGDAGQTILSSPLTNHDIFDGESLAPLAIAMRNSTGDLGIITGLMPIFAFLALAKNAGSLEITDIVLFVLIAGLILGAFMFIYPRFLACTALISARQALHHPPAWAVAISIFYSCFTFFLTASIGGVSVIITFAFLELFRLPGFELYAILWFVGLVFVVLSFEVVINIHLQGGSEDVIRLRRPGTCGCAKADAFVLENPEYNDRLLRKQSYK
jgi:hypothetical protein